MRRQQTFWKDEAAAVTVDYVVLTAGIIALNIFAIVAIMEDGMDSAGNAILSALLESAD